MTIVNITINDRKIQAQAGQTVLDAARMAGIEIPTLCHHPAITPFGGCRMCLVEVERQRGLQPACTFPVTEGMVVATETERVVVARKFVLDLIFSERQHYCMYCAMSGSEEMTTCELQRLAYRYGLTNWKYAPDTARRWPLDASRKYFFMDHSRCILCRRCVRACAEVAANHTLGVRERGARTMIIADADVPFGESTCVSCGACLQVCPTGALIDRRSAYMGGRGEVERTRSTCMACAVGCGIAAVTRSNQLLRVEGDWEAANGGLLCVAGRFAVVEPQPRRLDAPMIRRDGVLTPATWDEALAHAAAGLRRAQRPIGLASPRATNETLSAFAGLFGHIVAAGQIGLLDGETPPLDLGARASLGDAPVADCIVIVGGNPAQEQRVLAYLAKRGVDHGSRLILVSDQPTDLDPWAQRRLSLAEVAQVQGELAAAVRPVVLYAAGLPESVYSTLRGLPERVKFLPLVTGVNAVGAAGLGLRRRRVTGDALYVLAADEPPSPQRLPAAGFTVVQSAYWTPWVEAADVALPARMWAEQSGHVTNVEGRTLPVTPCLRPAGDLHADRTTLGLLAARLRA